MYFFLYRVVKLACLFLDPSLPVSPQWVDDRHASANVATEIVNDERQCMT